MKPVILVKILFSLLCFTQAMFGLSGYLRKGPTGFHVKNGLEARFGKFGTFLHILKVIVLPVFLGCLVWLGQFLGV